MRFLSSRAHYRTQRNRCLGHNDVTSRMLKSSMSSREQPIYPLRTETGYDASRLYQPQGDSAHLAGRKDSLGKIFFIFPNPRRVRLGQVADWMRTFEVTG